MKKIATAALICASIATTASADFIQYKSMAHLHGNVDYGMMKVADNDLSALDFQVGVTYQTENYEFNFDYVFENPTDSNYVSFGSFELNAGYRVVPQATVYGLVSYDYESSVADGIGFGLGAKYQLIDYIALTAKYKHTSMAPVFGDNFSKDIATVGIEFNFKDAKGNMKWQ